MEYEVARPNICTQMLQTSSFQIGCGNFLEFSSTTHEDYVAHPLVTTLPPVSPNRHTQSNFTFGKHKEPFETTTTANYRDFGIVDRQLN